MVRRKANQNNQRKKIQKIKKKRIKKSSTYDKRSREQRRWPGGGVVGEEGVTEE